MKHKIISIIFLFFSLGLMAQVTPPPPKELPENTTVEEQMENITASMEDETTEDDSYLQELAILLEHPLNLNYADAAALQQLRMLTPIQINNFLNYRNKLGLLISFYELQAVPGWDVATIQKIKPYIIVAKQLNVRATLSERFTKGDYSLMGRVTQVVEEQRGFIKDSLNNSKYLGSPQRLLLRLRYNYKGLLQYGFTGEKDPGEQFFKGGQKQGFDFYSAHLFIRNIGSFKAIALGDFTVNLGQGLTQWMSLAYRKGPDVTAIKRQGPVLKPYNSSGEIFFHRGVGATIGKKNWEATLFGSYRKLDANLVSDTAIVQDDYVTSLQTSGYHRTASEIADKNVQTQLAVGGNVKYRFQKATVGLNGIQYQFDLPINRASDPYNYYAISGKKLGNYSIDYSYTGRTYHFFGEAAINNKQYPAFINGLMLSASSNVDFTAVYRNISPGYNSLYTNAFTESTYPTNEKGLFTGVSIKPVYQWRIDAYADIYKFSWLKYGVNAPSVGKDYLLQVSYRPNKQFDMYARYRTETKGSNFNPDGVTLHPVVHRPKQSIRTQFSFKASPAITLRSRAEMVWFDKRSDYPSNGFLTYADVIYKPMMKPIALGVRAQYFETDDYSSRIYAYENDVLYSYSIPVFYGKGYRYYLNVNYDFSKRFTVWGRYAVTAYKDRQTVGSGYDEIKGNKKSEAKLQFIYKF